MINRREFLISLSALTGTLLLEKPLLALAAERMACPPVLGAKNPRLILGVMGFVCSVDLLTRECRAVPVPASFEGHSFLQHPHHPERFWALEKWGISALEVDFQSKKVTHRLESPADTQFSGHGVFSADGETLFITQVRDNGYGTGHLLGYHSRTFQLVADFQITPADLHDIHRLDDGTFLAASTGVPHNPKAGWTFNTKRIEETSLVHFEPKSGKVLNKKFVADLDQIISHFYVAKNGTVVAVSTPAGILEDSFLHHSHGEIYISRADHTSPWKKVEIPLWVNHQLRGELLSVTVDEQKNIAAVTNPGSSTVLFIDLFSAKLIDHTHTMAKGVALNPLQERFISNGLPAESPLLEWEKTDAKPIPFLVKNFPLHDGPTSAHILLV